MKYKIITGVALLMLMTLACKKTELIGDLEILQGKWQWEQTTYDTGVEIEIRTPISEDYNIEIEFLKNGEYVLYRNNKEEESGRVLIKDTLTSVCYIFTLDKKGFGKPYIYEDLNYEEEGIIGEISLYFKITNDDTLRIYHQRGSMILTRKF